MIFYVETVCRRMLSQGATLIGKELTVTGMTAIKLIKHPDFQKTIKPLDILFNDGHGDESKDEKILSFEDDHFVTTVRKYSLQIFRNEMAEMIFPESSDEILQLLKLLQPSPRDPDGLLTPLGYPVGSAPHSREEKFFILSMLKASTTPSVAKRSRFFDLAKDTKKLVWCSRAFERWLLDVETESKPEAVGRMHLGYVYRHTGRFDKAIKVTNVVEFSRAYISCPPQIMSILATIRAATFLDIFDGHKDRELLLFARKTINKAWAINQSKEASMVYKRLDKYEKEVAANDYKEKINEAYKNWRNWTN